ncbi:MAG: DAK2 domain-containing protein, partial [Bacillota bacterium]
MRFEYLQGEDFRHLLTGSLHMLGRHKAEIDALNVFPVPDGDTGTNMYLTLLAGLQEAEELSTSSMGEIAAAIARGALLGARGNSGVILSQIWQGFARSLAGCQQAGVNELAQAFAAGAQAAYQAVSNPVEGTILTVIKAAADAFAEAAGRDYDLLRSMVHVLRRSREALARTPELLPVLREAGVVDAGGRGLVVILEGIVYALKMAAARSQLELFDLAANQQKEFIGRVQDASALLNYTYCTEFILRGQNLPLETMRRELAPYGDCLLVVGDGAVAKVHIHSNHPGLVLECCLKYGS